jgi:rhodanese-related sulfurtransferase
MIGSGVNTMVRYITQKEILLKSNRFLDSTFGTPAADKLLLVEIGPFDSFEIGHIQRAIHMSLRQINTQASSLLARKGAEIVLYGQSEKDLPDLELAARHLNLQGYPNIFIYLGGKKEWLSANLSYSSSLVPADGFQTTKQDGTVPINPLIKAA